MPTDAERIRALTAAVESQERTESRLQKSIDDLHESIEVQNLHNIQKHRWSIGAAAFAVILAALVTVGYFKQVETSDRLVTLIEQQAQTTARLERLISQQEILRFQVLCPLYKVLLGSYAPESRAAGPERVKYEQVFLEMRNQYAVLACVGDLAPPRGDLVTKPPR